MIPVYHGSYTAIEEVDLAYCEPGKDFGQGFYVTNLPEQARTWATRIGRDKGTEGVVTEFELDEYVFVDRDLKVLRFDGYTNEWLDFVVLNRRNRTGPQAHDYDVVEGPVADDKVATEVDRFMEGTITREQFLADLVYNPSHQICFCTAQSLQALTPTRPKRLRDIDTYSIGDEVMQELMREYGVSEVEAADLYYNSETHATVADEITGYYQKPWQEIYALLRDELKI